VEFYRPTALRPPAPLGLPRDAVEPHAARSTTRMAEHNFKNYDVNTSWKNKFSTKNLRTHHLPSEIKI
jgi:hypothetical protein